MLKPILYNGQSAEELFGKRDEITDIAEPIVKSIIADVRLRGDKAVSEYSLKFDGYADKSLTVTDAEFDAAFDAVDDDYKAMLIRSIENIRAFHSKQKRDGFSINDGDRVIGQKVTPLSRVAVYVPGGTAAYPSTVLMNAVPAAIAGVKETVIATPVKSDGKVKPEVLVAAKLCGVNKVYKMGGAQAIAALAYGTESVAKVDKITGPGNAYVAEAKRQVSGVACGIDMLAGPSEILVIADGGANADHVAADMLAQAEHDALASALLICTEEKFAYGVIDALYARADKLPRKDIAIESIKNNCKIIVVNDVEKAVELADEYAPEHLELCVADPFPLLDKVTNAGSVFLGYNTPEAVGDYYAGANHTLPTSGTARFASPLGVDDFVKTTQYIYYSENALRSASRDIERFAHSEGLDGHAESVAVRGKR